MIRKYTLYIECVVSYGRMMNNGRLSKLLDMVFESTYYGLAIVDDHAKIQYISNEHYGILKC